MSAQEVLLDSKEQKEDKQTCSLSDSKQKKEDKQSSSSLTSVINSEDAVKLKLLGNESYCSRDFIAAMRYYQVAIDVDP